MLQCPRLILLHLRSEAVGSDVGPRSPVLSSREKKWSVFILDKKNVQSPSNKQYSEHKSLHACHRGHLVLYWLNYQILCLHNELNGVYWFSSLLRR